MKKDSMTLKWICQVSGRALWWTALLMLIRILQGYVCVQYAYALGKVVDQATAGVVNAFFQQLARFIGLVVLTLALQISGRYVSEKSKAVLDRAFRMHTFSQLLRRV